MRDCHANHVTHGLSKAPEYKVWAGIVRRCEDRDFNGYKKYGARGISICAEWRNDFAVFYRDMGPRPSPKHSIDRIDNSGNYEPGNCRWVTSQVQANNRRSNRLIIYRGVEMTLANAIELSGCSVGYAGVRYSLSRGWDVERAL